MKIEILCGDGSTNGVHVSDIFGENGRVGVGGSEIALLTMCEGWAKVGHEVVLYNNPKRRDGIFEQRPVNSFEKKSARDILVVFREPTPKIVQASGKKVFWSCDQYTTGDFRHFTQFVDKIVTISPYHTKYFKEKYGIRDAVNIDLPVRTWEYEQQIEKIPNRLIFTSVPDRGLNVVRNLFSRIRDIIPDVSLVVTSDYRLWGTMSPMNDEHRQRFIRQNNVQFLGAVPRSRLIEEQLKAQIHFYPCIYPELFCISCAESQVAGVIPITTPIGALETTNMGVVIDGDANDMNVQQAFVQKTVEYLHNRKLGQLQKELRERAKERFSLDRILGEWNEKVING